MESQRILEKTPPPPADLRSLLEKKAQELEKATVGAWSDNVCGPI